MSYRARIDDDLKRWQEAGLISAEGARAIRSALDGRQSRFGLPHVLALLGGVLLCFAAMTFVASNWQAMSKLLRLGVLAIGLWGSFAAAFAFFRRGQEAFGHSAVLVGSGVFGAAIMLIAQMYHIDGHPPDAVLVWGIGAALAGVALRSSPALVLAALLLALWSGWESVLNHSIHWAFVPAWVGLTAASLAVTRWRPLYHVLVLTLAVWTFDLGLLWSSPSPINRNLQAPSFHISALAGLALAVIATLATPLIDRFMAIGRATVAYMLAASYAGLWGFQFIQHASRFTLDSGYGGRSPIVVWFVLALAGLIAIIIYALRTDNRPVLWVAYAAFTVELVSIYFKTLGTLMSTSLFFLSAGLLVIALAWIAWKLHSRAPALLGDRS